MSVNKVPTSDRDEQMVFVKSRLMTAGYCSSLDDY